jgi:hypothetical protein
MPRLVAFLSLVLLVLAFALPAQAFDFGAEEKLHPLVDVELKGAEGEDLTLGFKTTLNNFILPYSLSDDGYVLLVRGQNGKFYELEQERVAAWQEAGFLPDPFPAYEIPLMERIFSYGLYFAILLALPFYIVPAIRKRRARKLAAGPQEG